MTPPRHVVAFAIPAHGHVSRMLPIVAGLRERGISVDFFAHEMSRRAVEMTGARFVDLYDGRDMDVPDDTSMPLPLRNVSFAGHWADDVLRQVVPLRPALILHDTFAVIGRAIAFHLGLPRVNVRAGHNMEPTRAIATLGTRGEVHVADACHAAVATLRERHGIRDASPMSFFVDHDADLNICAEPPEFLSPAARAAFAPLECFGSYWTGRDLAASTSQPFGAEAHSRIRVFAALGTAAMMMMPERALTVLSVIADALGSYPNTTGLMAVGSRLVPPEAIERLRRPTVVVEPFVDQIAALRQASVFVTHHGLNSTHEAIVHGVPMISCPLFGDQPGMAEDCQRFGLAVPVEQRGPAGLPTVDGVHRALDTVLKDDGYAARVSSAREWELAVMAQRPRVLQRIVDLMAG
ncbi:MAG: glycosyltransferase [Vicinamibacterales bacterium]